MSRAADLARLAALALMISDVRLAGLERAVRAREESQTRLAGLKRPAPEDGDPVALAGVALRYDRWAEGRRHEINLTLARQTADWLAALEQARGAFGRAEVLRRLSEGR